MALWSRFLARPTQTPLSSRPSLTLFFLIVGAFVLTLVPQTVHFPVWLSVVIALAMVLRSLIEVYRLPLPSIGFCTAIAIVLVGVIFAQYNTFMGRDAGTAFTAGLLTIKFYELRRPRDVSLIIFSCFFVVMSSLLYDQYLELFIYCLVMMWVLTALLLRVNTGDQHNDRLIRMLGKSGLIYLQALPLAFCLFFFFPRYSGTLSFSMDEAQIGITDNVAPGSIAKLSRDDTTAFYVRFGKDKIPSNEDMYWRGLVLYNYANGTWTPGFLANSRVERKDPWTGPEATAYDQEITITAHNQRWLFAIDAPVNTPINTEQPGPWAMMLNGRIVQLTGGKLNHMEQYDVKSSTAPIEEKLNEVEFKVGTKLPPLATTATDHATSGDTIDQSVHALADKLYGTGNEQDYLSTVLKFFRAGRFTYSTAPGVQGPDWLPVFLFQTRTGFCEHFASAFAILMRLEKIPTRLVVGYRGADPNPYSDTYYVYQSYAHAWDEVWIPSDHSKPMPDQMGHWVRVDPTAPIASVGDMRLTSNNAGARDDMTSQVTHEEGRLIDDLPAWMKDSMREAQLRREQVESGWDGLVLSYDPESQLKLAEALGFGQKAPAGLLLTCLIAGSICIVIFRKWMMRKAVVPPVESLYDAFCHNMARRGIPRATWEGPLAYTGRVAEAFPDDKLALEQVGDIVARARYGPIPADTTVHDNLKSLLTVLSASQATKR